MNKKQYKQFSHRLRTAWSQGNGLRFNSVAKKIANRMGVYIDMNRIDIVDGAYCSKASSALEFKSRLSVLDKQNEKRWCGAYKAISVMLDAVNHLNGWRVETIEEVYS